MPLRALEPVARGSQGFGLYEGRANDVFKPGETILTYVEPVGFG